uniref:Putative serine/threonine-protein kinase n=1 Tax=Aegilops tauschii TaxID=37682 RepID=M8B3X6_AEGTA
MKAPHYTVQCLTDRRYTPGQRCTSDCLKIGFDDPKVWKMSFKELQVITNDFSEEIGKGSVLITREVEQGMLKNGEAVAVKKLDHYLANQRKQIESEEHLKNLEHKNIVQLIGYCEETIHVPRSHESKPGEYTLVDMTESLLCYEFLSNGSLEDKMWKGRIMQANSPELDWKTRHTLIKGICEGLHYLHYGCLDAPIVHRDLKPANILLDDDMVPKLGDFGLSRIVPETQAHITAFAVGSSGYMAPETIGRREITPKADIYSLGVLILEVITGRSPPYIEYSGQCYVDKVREDRNQNSYVASRYPLLEESLHQQVDSWISIGLRCTEELPQRRPTIEHIIHFLEAESSSSLGPPDREVRMISFKEFEDITNKFSEKQLHGESIFGAVYEGTRVDGEEMIVIKLKEHRRPSETQFNLVVNGLRFEHKNILQLKGYCDETVEAASKRLLCYELLQNGSLDRKIFGDQSLTQHPWEERYRIIQDICKVLQYLHEECKDVHMGITAGWVLRSIKDLRCRPDSDIQYKGCRILLSSTPPRRPTAPSPCEQTTEHVAVATDTPQHHAAKYHQPTQLEVLGRSVVRSTCRPGMT